MLKQCKTLQQIYRATRLPTIQFVLRGKVILSFSYPFYKICYCENIIPFQLIDVI